MEITCSRCHQTLQDGTCYCPACGLPQLVYANDDSAGPGQSEPWIGAARDAASVNWRAALRSSLLLAVPAGLLCSLLSPVSVLGLFWMAAAAAWTVMLYVRSQQPAWITIGAGARIGLVTGVLGGWTAACASGVTLFAMRFVFHDGRVFDNFWQNLVGQQIAHNGPPWASTPRPSPWRAPGCSRLRVAPAGCSAPSSCWPSPCFSLPSPAGPSAPACSPAAAKRTSDPVPVLHSLPVGGNPSYHPARDT